MQQVVIMQQANNNSQSSYLSHAELQKRIRAAEDVTDFEIIFNEIDYMLERVRQAQLSHAAGVWEWCVTWAVARYHGQHEWADTFEMDRKTALLLLQLLCRRCKPDDDDPVDFKTLSEMDVCKEFGPDKIDRILSIFLPMDKANAFYKMTPTGQPHPGMPWYSKTHTQTDLAAHGVEPNPNGRGPLNRRYIFLVELANEYLESVGRPRIGKTYWQECMQPEMPPPLEERLARLGVTKN